MNRLLAASALACALAASACIPKDDAGPKTSAEGWRQVAAGAGQIIGKTKADATVARASATLDETCTALRVIAVGATLFSPERYRIAARQAAAAVDTICDSPPADVASALTLAADAYAAVVAVRDGA
ncbi:hypothetical protein [Bosea sp. (in: a-proteobacteria)]|uniref:hypothetical protein n=1 Tax=Bosea sp. (in: a-proteobacteria) TaxID=1871050 RepID=UPI00260E2354|nr:hypothetical protein [Bosea sp. (in: a-proteobacteria)]MCO5091551.1 hypothetical protein [Bosea sp. (in: a-proteobacteria)]